MSGAIQRVAPETREKLRTESPRARTAEVTIKLCAPTAGLIGPVLDQLMPLLEEMAQVLRDGQYGVDIAVPGYSDIWYGWEEDDQANGT